MSRGRGHRGRSGLGKAVGLNEEDDYYEDDLGVSGLGGPSLALGLTGLRLGGGQEGAVDSKEAWEWTPWEAQVRPSISHLLGLVPQWGPFQDG